MEPAPGALTAHGCVTMEAAHPVRISRSRELEP
jgi:hypothetical protein